MASQEELRLVAEVVAGRVGALEAFIAEYRTFVYAILTRHLNFTPADADEVFQRFLIHVWEDNHRRLRRWSGRGTLAAYIGTMVRNLSHDYRRESKRESAIEYAEPIFQGAGLAEDERVKSIQSALSKLSARDRELIHHRYDLGQSYKEIAACLGLTVSNVGVALHRAERRLKKLLAGGL
jgi:RNA polymerase sigma factor (sigma-70 family)